MPVINNCFVTSLLENMTMESVEVEDNNLQFCE